MFNHIRKWLACLTAALTLLMIAVLQTAASQKKPYSVSEINIGIQPSDYKQMTSTWAENKYDVNVSTNGRPTKNARIHTRGSGSKVLGFGSSARRLPIELSFNDAASSPPQISNTCVKFCNPITPFQLLAEHLAYDLFESMRIPVPAHTFAFLQYNDVDFGLYFLLEDINAEFLAKHFSQPYGSLYKGSDKIDGTPYASSRWFGDLSVTEDHGSDRIVALLRALESGDGYEEYIDTNEFVRFFACTAALGGASSILTEQSNYFLYDNDGKFILLPWDMTEAFAAYDTVNGIDHFQLDYWEKAPSCYLFDLLMQDEKNKELYHSYIKEINENFLEPDTINSLFQSLTAAITPYLQRDHTIFINLPYELPAAPEEGFGTIGSLLHTLYKIHENLDAQLNGSETVFYINPAHENIPPLEDFDRLMTYIISNSPTLDLDITNKICVGYTSYCRTRGFSRFATGDPAEFVAAFAVFAVALLILIPYIYRPAVGRRVKKNKNQSAHRRC